MDNLIGKKLDGRYLIEELVGSGGMANVYRATDLKNEHTVAVKILRDEFLNNEDLVRRFKNESKAIAVLDHPSVVKVFDISVTDKLQFIVMEFIDGITLHEYMERRGQALTYKEALFFITQALGALSHAHEKGVVHRDIKPQNIMLLEDGTIRVMDFGIARFSRAQSSATDTDKAIGSVHYISPEQAKGDETDAKSDIYSTGVMMYEMLCGKLPFESDSMVSVAIKQISDTAKPLREINPEIPEALEAITCRAMAKDPLQRYASAKDMLADIEEFKKNPSVRFEYEYMSETTPERYIDKIVKKPKQTVAPKASAAREPSKKQAVQPKAATKKAKKKRRYALPIMAGMATAFAIGAAVLVYMIFKLSGNPLFNNKIDIDLPDFTGMSYAAIKANEAYKVDFKFAKEEKYNEAEAGIVYDQFPKSGKMIKQGSKITLRVSLGQEMVTMPNVVGKTKEEAQKLLKDLNLYLSYRTEITTAVPAGQITKTEPQAGTTVTARTTVYLYESRVQIPNESKVPLIQGVNIDEARNLLRKANLAVGTVTKEESTLEEGTIITQSPAADETVKKGTMINVVVAKPIEARERTVTVKFAETINTAVWSMTLNGVVLEQHSTLDGQEGVWVFKYAERNLQTLHLTSSLGASYSIEVDFSTVGTDMEVQIGGTYVASETNRAVVITIKNYPMGTKFVSNIEGAVTEYTTSTNGGEEVWKILLKGRGRKKGTITGGPETSFVIDFTASGLEILYYTFTGTYVAPVQSAPPLTP